MIFATFDTETTGLPKHRKSPLVAQPKIIEFGGILTDGETVIDSLEFICNPGIAIEQIITDITGLTNADLADKPPFSAFKDQITNFFSRADAFFCHNASFDEDMLDYECQRLDIPLADLKMPPIKICTVEQTFHQYGRRMKLIELYQIHVGEYVQKHRALDDVMRLHELCQALNVYNMFYRSAKGTPE